MTKERHAACAHEHRRRRAVVDSDAFGEAALVELHGEPHVAFELAQVGEPLASAVRLAPRRRPAGALQHGERQREDVLARRRGARARGVRVPR